jgi:hypothetical protein
MKFMVTWEVHPDKRQEALKNWCSLSPEQQMDAGPGVKIIGRWHDLASFTGVAICEAQDAAALSGYLLQWNSVMDIDASPVLDDAETTAAGKTVLGL